MPLDIQYYNDMTHAVYSLDSDPTVFNWGPTNARLYSFLFRTDNNTTYIKTGPNAQDWTIVVPGGGGGTIYQYNGVPVPGAPHTTVDFIGDTFDVTDGGGGLLNVVNHPSAILYWGNRNVDSSTTVRYMTPGFEDALAEVTDNRPISIPFPTTFGPAVLRNLVVRHNTVNGNGDAVTYKVLNAGTPTGISVTLGTGAVLVGTDTVNTALVTFGAPLTIEITKAASIGSGILDVTVSLMVGF